MEASLLVTYETQYPLSMIHAMRTLLWSRVAGLYNLFGNHVSQFAFCFSKKIRGADDNILVVWPIRFTAGCRLSTQL